MDTCNYPQLSDVAINLLEARYLLPGESVDQMFWRVAKYVASAERKHDPAHEKEIADRFFRMMCGLLFLPNSPTLMNAGTPLGQLSACFVIPIEDSLESIFEAAKQAALIQKTGGGVGYDFSSIRPQDDLVRSTQKGASGPLPFIEVFNAVTEAINQGGRRRGANMGVLRVDHPDILEFIEAKRQDGVLSNFNLSVAVSDDFMKALESDQDFPLRNPRTGKVTRAVPAKELFNALVEAAWANGEPGVLFIDRINRANPTPGLGPISATNPCGEQPLLPWESCNLGSVNLARMVGERDRIDWRRIEEVVQLAVRFLDDVMEVNRFPLPVIEQVTLESRKIGLGVMGFADLLIKLGIPYDSDEALSIADRIMGFIQSVARRTSFRLGRERGSFPLFARSVFAKRWSAMRNATVTSIAPTGSLSLIAGCSSSLEPLFGFEPKQNPAELGHLKKAQPLDGGRERNSAGRLSLRSGPQPKTDREQPITSGIVRTVYQVSGEWQVRMQAVFQNHVDNAVSKTVNLCPECQMDEVAYVVNTAYRHGCKGVTIYRSGSRNSQVLTEQSLNRGGISFVKKGVDCRACSL